MSPTKPFAHASLRSMKIAAFVLAICCTSCTLWQAPAPVTTQPIVAAPPPADRLSAEAIAALAQAKQRVAEAKASRTLWKSAFDKLAVAELAAVKQDSQLTLKLANEIVALCQLSTAQASLPAVVW